MTRSSWESAAVLHGAGDIRIEQRETPAPSEDQLLVEVGAVGVCGSDVHYFEHGAVGPNVVREPHILGHEVSGLIVAAGRGVDGDWIGERVAIEPGIGCGVCDQCRAGQYNLCPRMRFLGAPPMDGALRGHIAIPSALAFPLPDEVSDQAGALIEPLAVAVHACRRGGVGAGSEVLITGAGPVGLLVAQVAMALGAGGVTIVDVNQARLEWARALGVCDHACSPEALGERNATAAVLIECSGAPDALSAGLECVRPSGTVVVVGMAPEGSIALPLAQLQRRELTVTGSFRYANCFPEAIELAASGRVALEPLITARFALDDIASALRATRQDPAHVKVIVLPGSIRGRGR